MGLRRAGLEEIIGGEHVGRRELIEYAGHWCIARNSESWRGHLQSTEPQDDAPPASTHGSGLLNGYAMISLRRS